jgi:uncharacterized membrane protein YbhN (UPF0104 family)
MPLKEWLKIIIPILLILLLLFIVFHYLDYSIDVADLLACIRQSEAGLIIQKIVKIVT